MPSSDTTPAAVRLRANMELALLFRTLATLRTDEPLFRDVDEIRWQGPQPGFEAYMQKNSASRVLERAARAASGLA